MGKKLHLILLFSFLFICNCVYIFAASSVTGSINGNSLAPGNGATCRRGQVINFSTTCSYSATVNTQAVKMRLYVEIYTFVGPTNPHMQDEWTFATTTSGTETLYATYEPSMIEPPRQRYTYSDLRWQLYPNGNWNTISVFDQQFQNPKQWWRFY